jgi:hypothetical protein
MAAGLLEVILLGKKEQKLTKEQIAENEQKKDFLKGYKRLYKKLESLEDQMKSIRIAKESAQVQSIDDMPKGSKQTDLSDYMIKLDEVLTKIILAKGEKLHRQALIEEKIAELQDGIESMILHKKYIEFKHWEQICIEIGYEWAETHRKHSKALQHFKL